MMLSIDRLLGVDGQPSIDPLQCELARSIGAPHRKRVQSFGLLAIAAADFEAGD
jgi:hypothetical protein